MSSMPSHPRIAVVFASPGAAGAGDWLLLEGDVRSPPGVLAERFVAGGLPGDAPGCVCCAAKNPAAEALRRLFLAGTRSGVPSSGRVLACVHSAAGREAVVQAVSSDRFGAARFRLGEVSG